MFQHGDIVINFYRRKIYYFDDKNKTHRTDFFRCRHATFDEQEIFKTFGQNEVRIKEIGVRFEKEAEIKIKLIPGRLIDLHRFAEKLEVRSYEEVFFHILRNSKTDSDKEIGDLKKENKELKEKLKNIGKILNL
jgi:hypothetical protein